MFGNAEVPYGIPFSNGSVDLITSFGIGMTGVTLAEIHRVLKSPSPVDVVPISASMKDLQETTDSGQHSYAQPKSGKCEKMQQQQGGHMMYLCRGSADEVLEQVKQQFGSESVRVSVVSYMHDLEVHAVKRN